MANQDGFLILCQDREIPGNTLRVFLYLCSQAGFENTLHVTQQEIADLLHMRKPNVTRSIKTLERKGLIARLHGNKRTYAFMINPYYVWKGRMEHFNRGQRKFDSLRRQFVVVENIRQAG